MQSCSTWGGVGETPDASSAPHLRRNAECNLAMFMRAALLTGVLAWGAQQLRGRASRCLTRHRLFEGARTRAALYGRIQPERNADRVYQPGPDVHRLPEPGCRVRCRLVTLDKEPIVFQRDHRARSFLPLLRLPHNDYRGFEAGCQPSIGRLPKALGSTLHERRSCISRATLVALSPLLNSRPHHRALRAWSHLVIA
jgi:hypothetical protein